MRLPVNYVCVSSVHALGSSRSSCRTSRWGAFPASLGKSAPGLACPRPHPLPPCGPWGPSLPTPRSPLRSPSRSSPGTGGAETQPRHRPSAGAGRRGASERRASGSPAPAPAVGVLRREVPTAAPQSLRTGCWGARPPPTTPHTQTSFTREVAAGDGLSAGTFGKASETLSWHNFCLARTSN